MNEKITVIIPVYNQESLVIRALDSIPADDEIEILVIDDGSTDDTWDKLLMYQNMYHEKKIILLYNSENQGVAKTVNKGLDNASGEYIVLLGSDDYFLPQAFEKIKEHLDGTDLVYFNLQINDGTVFRLNKDTKTGYCGSTKFMRKEFIGDTRNPEDVIAGEDFFFYQELLSKNPSENFTGIIAKHYNFPRVGSLSDMKRKGEIE